MQSRTKAAIFAAATFAVVGAASSSAYAVTSHKHAHRAAPPPDITQTLAQPAPEMMPVAPYYQAPESDDSAFDAPWDPTFGWGRQPYSSGSGAS